MKRRIAPWALRKEGSSTLFGKKRRARRSRGKEQTGEIPRKKASPSLGSEGERNSVVKELRGEEFPEEEVQTGSESSYNLVNLLSKRMPSRRHREKMRQARLVQEREGGVSCGASQGKKKSRLILALYGTMGGEGWEDEAGSQRLDLGEVHSSKGVEQKKGRR